MKLDVSQYALAHALDVAHGSHKMDGWHPGLPDHLSPTSIALFQRCPEAFRRRYVLRQKERPGESLTIGSAVHRALEWNFEQKIQSHVDRPTAELLDYFDDVAWGETLEDNVDTAWDTTPELAHIRARKMSGEYHQQVAPRVQPLAVETRISIEFGAPIPVWGVFDVEEAEQMIDFKTAKQRRSTPKGDWKIQAAIYHEHARKPVDFHVISVTEKTGTVAVTTPLEQPALQVAPSDEQRDRMREDVRMIAGTISFYMAVLGPDSAWPTFGIHHDWACQYCGFRNSCPAWAQ